MKAGFVVLFALIPGAMNAQVPSRCIEQCKRAGVTVLFCVASDTVAGADPSARRACYECVQAECGDSETQPAELISPQSPKLETDPVVFTWSAGKNVANYHFFVGVTPGGSERASVRLTTQRSATVSMPGEAGRIYVTLWSQPRSGASSFMRTYEFDWPGPPSVAMRVVTDTALQGAALRGVPLRQADAGLCRGECERDPACRAFTYYKPGFRGQQPYCELLSSMTTGAMNACCVSGIKGQGAPTGPAVPAAPPPAAPGALTWLSAQAPTACGRSVGPAIYAKWQQLGGQGGILGCATANETDAPRSPMGTTGRWIPFSGNFGGTIVLHGSGRLAGRSFETHGYIYRLYASLGGTASWLGFPISDEYAVSGGRRSDFEAGLIYFDQSKAQAQAFPYQNVQAQPSTAPARPYNWLSGTWHRDGDRRPAYIVQMGNFLLFANESGDSSRGRFDRADVIADDWQGGLRGRILENGAVIQWANGIIWRRAAPAAGFLR